MNSVDIAAVVIGGAVLGLGMWSVFYQTWGMLVRVNADTTGRGVDGNTEPSCAETQPRVLFRMIPVKEHAIPVNAEDN